MVSAFPRCDSYPQGQDKYLDKAAADRAVRAGSTPAQDCISEPRSSLEWIDKSPAKRRWSPLQGATPERGRFPGILMPPRSPRDPLQSRGREERASPRPETERHRRSWRGQGQTGEPLVVSPSRKPFRRKPATPRPQKERARDEAVAASENSNETFPPSATCRGREQQ